MWILIGLIIVFVLVIINMDKINAMFTKVTTDELVDYQRNVFTHIDDEIKKYKLEVQQISDKSTQDMKKHIEEMEELLIKYEKINSQLDEKIQKIDNFKKMTNF